MARCPHVGRVRSHWPTNGLRSPTPRQGRQPADRPALTCYAREVKFPVESDLMWIIILGSPLKYPHDKHKSIITRLNLVNIGNAQILTIPGEALPNIGYYLKRHMK